MSAANTAKDVCHTSPKLPVVIWSPDLPESSCLQTFSSSSHVDNLDPYGIVDPSKSRRDDNVHIE